MRRRLADLGLPVPDFADLSGDREQARARLVEFGEAHDWEIVLKTVRGGYDGRGVWLLDRRDAALDVSDRISVAIVGDEPVWQAVLEHQGLIMGETLAVQLGAAGGDQVLPGATPMTLSDGLSANVALKKVEPR